VIEAPPGRQTCLYTVMPHDIGERLAARLSRAPAVGAGGGPLFRTVTGAYRYGNAGAASAPTLKRPRDLATLRPNLPVRLQVALGRGIALNPAERFAIIAEFAHEFESGPSYAPRRSAVR
jgi:hypothetical protein